GDSDPTLADGERAPEAIDGFTVEVDGFDEHTTPDATTTTWDDLGAPAGTIDAGGAIATATEGTDSAHVALTVGGVTASSGAERTYTVRAITENANEGAESDEKTGHRTVTLAYQWERSAGDADADYAPLPGA